MSAAHVGVVCIAMSGAVFRCHKEEGRTQCITSCPRAQASGSHVMLCAVHASCLRVFYGLEMSAAHRGCQSVARAASLSQGCGHPCCSCGSKAALVQSTYTYPSAGGSLPAALALVMRCELSGVSYRHRGSSIACVFWTGGMCPAHPHCNPARLRWRRLFSSTCFR